MWNNDRPEMGTHVVISGSTLRSMVERLCTTQAEILLGASRSGASFTRLDLAVDAVGVSCDERHIYLQSMVGNVRGTARNFSLMENSNGGKTLYVGSRSSERFIRLYDKASESGLDGVLWHRLELETKGMVARSVATLLLQNTDWHSVFTGVVRHMADFPDIPAWTQFFEGVQVPIGTPKIERQSDTENWIDKQVISAVLKYYAENKNSPAVARLIEALIWMKKYQHHGGVDFD